MTADRIRMTAELDPISFGDYLLDTILSDWDTVSTLTAMRSPFVLKTQDSYVESAHSGLALSGPSCNW